MVEEVALDGDSLLVLDTVDKPQLMADTGKNGETKQDSSGGEHRRQEASKHRQRSRSPISGPSRRGGRRGGYRGWDRSADEIDNKTNSEEPHLKRARLFVGNIATDKVTRRDLAQLFGQYGKVLGVSIHNGFAFVQMDRERDANRAIICEDNQVFMGSKIHVEFSQAAKQAGARQAHQGYSPPPLSRERERDFGGGSARLDDRSFRDDRLERIMMMEREMAYLQAREDLYNEMYSRSQVEPPSMPAFEHHREDSYRRPPLSPPPPNPYPSSRERDYPMERLERVDDRRPYYSRSEISSTSMQPPNSRTELLSYPLPRNRSGSGARGADLLAAAYGGAATSGKNVGYSAMGGSGSFGSSKSSGSGGYSTGKSPGMSGWYDYPPRGGSTGNRGNSYWN